MDQEMFIRAKEGDSDTISVLYSMAYEPMRIAANSVLHNASDAEDAAMDAVETMLQRIHQLDKPESFLPWAKQIATNKAKDYVKKKKPILIAEAEDDEAPGFWEKLEEVDTENMPEFTLERRESNRLVRDAAKSLGKDLYAVLKYAYVDEMKLSEISEKLGVNLNTIKTRKRTAEKRLYEWAMEQEKEGVYLHGMTPVEFWLWLLRNSKGGVGFRFDPGNLAKGAGATSSGAAAAASTAAETVATTATASAGNAGSFLSVVSSSVSHAFAALSAKTVAIVTAAVVGIAGVGGAAISAIRKNNPEPPVAESTEIEEPTAVIQESSAKEISSAVSSKEESMLPESVNVLAAFTWKDGFAPEYVSARLVRYENGSDDMSYMSEPATARAVSGWTCIWTDIEWNEAIEAGDETYHVVIEELGGVTEYFHVEINETTLNGRNKDTAMATVYCSLFDETPVSESSEPEQESSSKGEESSKQESETGRIIVELLPYRVDADGKYWTNEYEMYAGTVVQLLDKNRSLLGSITSGNEATYFQIDDLPLGDYYVEVIPVELPGYTITLEDTGKHSITEFYTNSDGNYIVLHPQVQYDEIHVEESSDIVSESEVQHIHHALNKVYYTRSAGTQYGGEYPPYYEYWICPFCLKQFATMSQETYDSLTWRSNLDQLVLVSGEEEYKKHVDTESSDPYYTNVSTAGIGYYMEMSEYYDPANDICEECGLSLANGQNLLDEYYVCDICKEVFSAEIGIDGMDEHLRNAHPVYTADGRIATTPEGTVVTNGSYTRYMEIEANS